MLPLENVILVLMKNVASVKYTQKYLFYIKITNLPILSHNIDTLL